MSGSVFYDSFLEEMRIAHKLGKILDFSGLQFGLTIEKENISEVLQKLGLTSLMLDAEEVGLILSAMKNPGTPYA
jgi:hypothetical protein